MAVEALKPLRLRRFSTNHLQRLKRLNTSQSPKKQERQERLHLLRRLSPCYLARRAACWQGYGALGWESLNFEKLQTVSEDGDTAPLGGKICPKPASSPAFRIFVCYVFCFWAILLRSLLPRFLFMRATALCGGFAPHEAPRGFPAGDGTPRWAHVFKHIKKLETIPSNI